MARRQLTAEELRVLVQDGRAVFALMPTAAQERALDASGVEWYTLPTLDLSGPPADVLERLQDAMTEAFSHALTGNLNFLQSGLLTLADERLERGGNAYPTGLLEFDEAIGGGFYDGLHVLGGVTGGGKTALALAVAESNARAGRPVLYVTYEQSRYELWGRLISTRVGVGLRQLRTGGTIDQPISAKLRENSAYIDLTNEVAPWLSVVEGNGVEGGSWGIDRIAAQVRRLKSAHGVAPLVILDYLQRMPSGDTKDRRHQIDDVVTGLQVRLGREQNAPILLISSVGRGKYGELVGQPLEERLGVFKESGGVEYTAYTASLLYPLGIQDAYALGLDGPPVPGTGRAALHGLWKYLVLDLVKNREGEAPRQWVVKWYPASGRFELVMPVDADSLAGEKSTVGGRRNSR
ncbi:DnaB-like helicase C-terminal domain-containing protein [Deinococcus sp. QL22]|uniref:DnaB-like helicase C-terminal domain-containing protein n=1 Tax=Deinococcus sp. QL22 TaxID=2939437 RepID=UPI0020179DDE|nr:DnaB-like helicase C-terminal domain-containing protein [Deinococcus sp. QL22]UQN10835.1 DnaB-like helicase C-terminal domain-containing protein [Deinococcus sp. QL22]